MFGPKLARLLEESLGCDSEELGRIGRAVVIDKRAVVVGRVANQLIEVVAEDARPRDVHRAAGKNRRSVAGAAS